MHPQKDAANITVLKHASAALFVDVDSDGDEDLFIATYGGPRYYLFINDGRGGCNIPCYHARTHACIHTRIHTHTLSLSLLSPLPLFRTCMLMLTIYIRAMCVLVLECILVLKHTDETDNVLYCEFNQSLEGVFSEQAAQRGVDLEQPNSRPLRGFTPAAGDLDGDGYPELWVSEYVVHAHILNKPSASRLFQNQGAQPRKLVPQPLPQCCLCTPCILQRTL